jgi:hypothetical protein
VTIHVTTKGERLVRQHLVEARQAMEPGKDTRNAYGDGKLAALESLANALGVVVHQCCYCTADIVEDEVRMPLTKIGRPYEYRHDTCGPQLKASSE